MKSFSKVLICLLAVATLLSGCVLRAVDELYALPKRSQADNDLQSVIDKAMTGLSYCTPTNGENRQNLQQADLDGDGENEYIILACDSAKNLKILIFRQLALGYALVQTIEGYGSTFDFVEFINLDDHPGAEIVVGRQVSDGSLRSAAVYRYNDGEIEQLLELNYRQFLCADLDGDGRGELVVMLSDEGSSTSSELCFYRYTSEAFECANRVTIDDSAEHIKRVEAVTLNGGEPAVMITANSGSAQTMQILCVRRGKLSSIYGPVSTEKTSGGYLYATDINNDGVIDLPMLTSITNKEGYETGEYWIRWYSVTSTGEKVLGMFTYYSAADHWYIHMDQNWTRKMTVTCSAGVCTFYNMDREIVLTIYALSGNNRQEQAQTLGGVTLGKTDSVTFVAVLGPGAEAFGITENQVKQLFYQAELELYT